ncbi:putative inactive dual specificity protein phosphatase-like [Hibiscus syriacus]|uniref:Inactive dual specificity protein phosphatase-like n=1 Tax=Hibiscus syriacus TaxID=106335 RepID=A0A6A3AWV9_HIBSY|nr:putative inactive dual specificity protein phosphatase-like [Hibiscus syriacus]
MSTTTQGDFIASNCIGNGKNEPDHLLVLVHGILARGRVEKDAWENLSDLCRTKTVAGVDGAGKRLADEVSCSASCTEDSKPERISFLAHSLGGLFARYAVAVLYSENDSSGTQSNNGTDYSDGNLQTSSPSRRGMIVGLEPVSFITLATPHLGVQGRKQFLILLSVVPQLPFLLGFPFLEKLAPPIAPVIFGRTGKQLFLTDGKPSRSPLLLRMASDCEDGKFLSSLGAFRSRTLYANVSYDQVLNKSRPGFMRTPDIYTDLVYGYKHVVDVEYCPPVSSDGPHFPEEAVKAKAEAQNAPNATNTAEYHELKEGLHKLGWKKVDVKNEWFHNAGIGVIAHVADSLKQQESSHSYISASL